MTAEEFLRLVRSFARNNTQRSAIDDLSVDETTTLREAVALVRGTGQFTDPILTAALSGVDGTGQSQIQIPNTTPDQLIDDLEETGVTGTGSSDLTATVGQAIENGFLQRSPTTGELFLASDPTAVLDEDTGLIERPGSPPVPLSNVVNSPVIARQGAQAFNEDGTVNAVAISSAYFAEVSSLADTSTGPTPIGVPIGWINPKPQFISVDDVDPERLAPGAPFAAPDATPGPKYFFNDDPDSYRNDAFELFAGKGPEHIAQVQADLVEAGYLQPGEFTPGRWGSEDGPSTRAMWAAMGDANSENDDILIYLAKRKLDPVPSGPVPERTPFVPSVQRTPSGASLATSAINALRAKVGRDPLPGEIDEVVSFLGDAYNRQYRLNETAAFVQHEATQDARLTGQDPERPDPVPSLDPLAEVDRFIESRFGPQIERAKIDADPRAPAQALSQALRIERRR